MGRHDYGVSELKGKGHLDAMLEEGHRGIMARQAQMPTSFIDLLFNPQNNSNHNSNRHALDVN
jgi:hypothetical protein